MLTVDDVLGKGPENAREVVVAYKARRWARKFHRALQHLRWATVVIHRRGGKTTAAQAQLQRAAADDGWETQRLLNLAPNLTKAEIRERLEYRVYAHVLPTLTQAKSVAWDMAKKQASYIPGARTNESELRIDFPCPKNQVRRVRLFGADQPDSMRGLALAGLVMDEFSQHPPGSFGEVLSKALADHIGFGVFTGTIKGKNQLYRSFKSAEAHPDESFALWQDIDRSLRTEKGATIKLLELALADDRKLVARGEMSQEEFDQEWYLSTEAAIKGAYYGRALAAARKAGRIRSVPWDPAIPVDTDWDLGTGNRMTIWFSQSLTSGEVRFIDYLQGESEGTEGQGFAYFAKALREKPYVYGQHWAPHDIQATEIGTGKTRVELAAGLGIKFEPTPSIGVDDGIEAARSLIARSYFDEKRCADGLEALTQYVQKWDDRMGIFTGKPLHNWASHAADAFRGCAVRHKTPQEKKAGRQRAVVPGAIY